MSLSASLKTKSDKHRSYHLPSGKKYNPAEVHVPHKMIKIKLGWTAPFIKGHIWSCVYAYIDVNRKTCWWWWEGLTSQPSTGLQYSFLSDLVSFTLSSGRSRGPGWNYRWASVTHLRLDLYLQPTTRKQLVNPFSLRPLICSYLLQQPKKSQGIFSSLLPIDPALRKSALLSKHYWSLLLNDRLSHQCIKGLDELKFHFRQLVPVIFTLFSIEENTGWQTTARIESISVWLWGERTNQVQTV